MTTYIYMGCSNIWTVVDKMQKILPVLSAVSVHSTVVVSSSSTVMT